jgi:hypothetical protein
MVIAQALLFQHRLGIVEAADEQVEFDKQGFDKTILSPLANLLFLPLIRILCVVTGDTALPPFRLECKVLGAERRGQALTSARRAAR